MCTLGAPRVFPFPHTMAGKCLPNDFPETHLPVGSLKFTISKHVFELIQLMVLAVFSSSLFSLFPLCSFCSFSFVFAFPPFYWPQQALTRVVHLYIVSIVFTFWEAKTVHGSPHYGLKMPPKRLPRNPFSSRFSEIHDFRKRV